jgi:phage shock protein PspC (stress-responsive transcriptional regulator)
MDTSTVSPEVLILEPEDRTEPHRTTLRRPFQGHMAAGAAAGLARYLRVDVTVVRIVLVSFTLFSGVGIPYLTGLLPVRSSGPCSSGRDCQQSAAGKGNGIMLLTKGCGCQLPRIGVPALAVVVVLTVLVLGVACWVINNPDRSDRVNRMMLARRGDGRCLQSDVCSAFPCFPPSAREIAASGSRRNDDRLQRVRPGAVRPGTRRRGYITCLAWSNPSGAAAGWPGSRRCR